VNIYRRRAVAALSAAGLLWGTTVPMSKLALQWLGPGWLSFARFGIAAVVLLLVLPPRQVRAACTPRILASGAIGYGGSVVVQNAGVMRTSVSHAALLIGATPVLVAIVAAAWQRTVARPVAWAGFALSLAGVALVAAGPGRGATLSGDGLVLASLLLSAAFTVAQGPLLRGRDPFAVTAIQFSGAALGVLPLAVAAEGRPAAPSNSGTVLALIGLAVAGTLLPFALFAYGQSRVAAEVAGAFLNLEPLVGWLVGVAAFGDHVGPVQVAGGAAVLAGIALSSLPLLGSGPGRPAGRTGAIRARSVSGPAVTRVTRRPPLSPVALPGAVGSPDEGSPNPLPHRVAVPQRAFCHPSVVQTDTCSVLSLVNGSRPQPPQRSRSVIPASCAIRSSSAGHTYRPG
jgi:O-acetylserine/cysteine efflux transporter